jgi:hypothetical protein
MSGAMRFQAYHVVPGWARVAGAKWLGVKRIFWLMDGNAMGAWRKGGAWAFL